MTREPTDMEKALVQYIEKLNPQSLEFDLPSLGCVVRDGQLLSVRTKSYGTARRAL